MFDRELRIKQKTSDMEVARVGTSVLEIVTAVVGGLAVHAGAIERRPLKGALFGVIAAGLGYFAYNAGNIHEDYARQLGALEGQQVRETSTAVVA